MPSSELDARSILYMKEWILVNWMLGTANSILHLLGDMYCSCIVHVHCDS